MLERNLLSSKPIALNAETVTARLEEAGSALLALPNTGPSTRLVQSGLEWIRDASEQFSHPHTKLRPAAPDAATITRMDEALAWIPLIPVDRFVLRRVVGARSLINPMSGRHVFSWRRIATAIGADHKAVQRWHAQGIDMIVAALAAPSRAPSAALPQRFPPLRRAVSPQPLPRPGATAPS